jgi:hypothetical protein
MTVVTPPLYLNVDSTYTAASLGLPFRDLVAEGVVGATDLAVSERGAGANMSVDIAAGVCWVRGDDADDQPTYRCFNDATVNLAVTAADATNDRIDLVVAEVRDAAFSGVSTDWRLRVVTGTPAGSPSAPSTPDNAIVLAEVLVEANATEVEDADITDMRPLATSGLIGPQGIYAAEDNDDGTRNSTSFGDLTGSTAGPSITVGPAGLYLVHIDAQIAPGAAGFGVASYSIGGTTASDDDGVVASLNAAGGLNVGRERPKTLDAGTTLTMKYRSSTSTTFKQRLIRAHLVEAL